MQSAPVLRPVAIVMMDGDDTAFLGTVLVRQVLCILLPSEGFPRDCATTVVENNDGGVSSSSSSSLQLWVPKFNRLKSNNSGPNFLLR